MHGWRLCLWFGARTRGGSLTVSIPRQSPGTSAGRFQPVSSWNEVKRVSRDVGNDKV